MSAAIDTSRLDPSRFADLDLGGEPVRQGIMRGLAAAWATQQPFYTINHSIPQVIAGRYRDVLEIYQDRERFTVCPPSLPGYERFDYFNGMVAMAQMDGAGHDRVRAGFNPSFGPAATAHIGPAVENIIDLMLSEVEALGGPFDLINDFAGNLVVRILLEGLLGLTPSQQKAFIRMNRAFSLIVGIAPGAAWPREFIESQEDVSRIIAELIASRGAQPRTDDFISNVVKIHNETGALSLPEIVNNLFAILAAGQGTTAISATAMLMNLCKHRDQFDAVIANPALIPQAVEESLHFQGPGFLSFARFATVACEIGGTLILPGMPVMVSQQAANLDPEIFPNPLHFDIHRNPRNILTFSAGSHLCLGNRLARKILQTVLQKICLRMPNLRLADPDFESIFEGMLGELRPISVPAHTGKT